MVLPEAQDNPYLPLLQRFDTLRSPQIMFLDAAVHQLDSSLANHEPALTARERDKALMEFGERVTAYKLLIEERKGTSMPLGKYALDVLMDITKIERFDPPALDIGAKYLLSGSSLDQLAYQVALIHVKLAEREPDYRDFTERIGSPAIQEYIADLLLKRTPLDDLGAESFFSSKRLEGYVQRLAYIDKVIRQLIVGRGSTQIVSIGAANFLGVLTALSRLADQRILYNIYETDAQAIDVCARIAGLYGFGVNSIDSAMRLERDHIVIIIELTEGDKLIAAADQVGGRIDVLDFAGLQEFLPDGVCEKMQNRFYERLPQDGHLIGAGLLAGFEHINAAYLYGSYHRLFPRTMEQVTSQLSELAGDDQIQLSGAENGSYYFYVMRK